ncbi:type II toxin-antitoxin system PemK/MazF family toxin [Actinomycetota bacterium]
MDHPKRAEIWLVSLEPVRGSEIGKTRPALIISNNRNNKFASTITLTPISTTLSKVYPFEVKILNKDSGLLKDSKIKCNQIRTVDKTRLLKKIGEVQQKYMNTVKKALFIHLDLGLASNHFL